MVGGGASRPVAQSSCLWRKSFVDLSVICAAGAGSASYRVIDRRPAMARLPMEEAVGERSLEFEGLEPSERFGRRDLVIQQAAKR